MNKKTSPIKNNAGFTLIEALVTVSIAAILLSIAVPNFTSMIKNGQMNSATNEFIGALVLARSEALKRNDNVSICTSTNLTSCTGGDDFAEGWIIFQDCNIDGNIDAGTNNSQCVNNGSERIIKVHEALPNVSLKPNINISYLAYKFSGRINVATTVLATEKGKTTIKKRITINRTGRVSTQ